MQYHVYITWILSNIQAFFNPLIKKLNTPIYTVIILLVIIFTHPVHSVPADGLIHVHFLD